MGARHSKRSVDITGKEVKDSGSDDSQPLDGKLEKIEDGAKVAVNGSSSHDESLTGDEIEHVKNGDHSKDSGPEAPLASPSSPVDESVSPPSGQEEEDPESTLPQPPKKKDKGKRKWSLRSFSFSKKDKAKPGKDEVHDDSVLVTEVVEEKAPIVGACTEAMGDAKKSVTTALKETVTLAEETSADTLAMASEETVTTKDKVEQITAKVAEKAEALVVKMEAMSIEAADAISNPVKDDKTDIKIAAPEETIVPEVDVSAPVINVLSGEVAVSEVKTCAPEVTVVVAEVSSVVHDATIIDPDETTVVQKVTTGVAEEADVTSDDKTSVIEFLASQDVEFATKLDIDPSNLEVDQEVFRASLNPRDLFPLPDDENPPPLPGSPPPIDAIADIVMEVVDRAVDIGESNQYAAYIAQASPVTTVIVPGPDTGLQTTIILDEHPRVEGDGSPSEVPSVVSDIDTNAAGEENPITLEAENSTTSMPPQGN